MMLRSILLLLLCITVSCTDADTQDETVFGMSGEMKVLRADYSDFNRELNELGYPGLERHITELGTGIQLRSDRLLSGINVLFGRGFSRENGEDGREVFYKHYRLSLNETGDLLNADQWVLGPQVSASLKYASISLANRDEVRQVQQITDTETHGLSRFKLTAAFGAAVQKYFDIEFIEFRQLYIGLNGGYQLDGGEDWNVSGAVPFEETGIKQGGLFAGLNMGLVL